MTETTTLNLASCDTQTAQAASEIYKHDYDAIFGTEPGLESLQKVLRVSAYNAGYTLFLRNSSWVSIKKSLILPGSYDEGHNESVTWARCEVEDFGPVAFLASSNPIEEEYAEDFFYGEAFVYFSEDPAVANLDNETGALVDHVAETPKEPEQEPLLAIDPSYWIDDAHTIKIDESSEEEELEV